MAAARKEHPITKARFVAKGVGGFAKYCTKGPQVFSCAAKLSESSMLSLLWRVRLRACRRMASSPIGEISKRTDVGLA